MAAAPDTDAATFARNTRNAVARAVLAAAFAPDGDVGAPAEPAPARAVRAQVGPELADELLALYEGGPDWTSRAIDLLRPLHELART